MIERDRAFAKKNGIDMDGDAKVYELFGGGIAIKGNVYIREGVSVPALTMVSGGLVMREGASAPALTTVGRSLYIDEGVSVPKGATIVGDIYTKQKNKWVKWKV